MYLYIQLWKLDGKNPWKSPIRSTSHHSSRLSTTAPLYQTSNLFSISKYTLQKMPFTSREEEMGCVFGNPIKFLYCHHYSVWANTKSNSPYNVYRLLCKRTNMMQCLHFQKREAFEFALRTYFIDIRLQSTPYRYIYQIPYSITFKMFVL